MSKPNNGMAKGLLVAVFGVLFAIGLVMVLATFLMRVK